MKAVASITESVLERLTEEIRAALVTWRDAEDGAARARVELGRLLARARRNWPERGPRAKGWGDYLASLGIEQPRAYEWMRLAGFVDISSPGDETPTFREAGLRPVDDREAPPPRDEDAPRETEAEPEKPGKRDGWCTPGWLTELLPKVDLDPCSNPHSKVRAKKTYSLEAGESGLELPWFGIVYVNGPYSRLEPWAEKLEAERANVRGAGFLVNADHSPAWWHVLTRHLHMRLDFDDRLEFDPPPGIDPSKNDRPQTLLMDAPFWAACHSAELLKLGTLWVIKRA